MGKFFSGLAQSGSWCCFDEFNRIDIEVLSVIAQQLITIRNAKASKVSRFMFEGREIKLIPCMIQTWKEIYIVFIFFYLQFFSKCSDFSILMRKELN